MVKGLVYCFRSDRTYEPCEGQGEGFYGGFTSVPVWDFTVQGFPGSAAGLGFRA